MRQDVYMSLNGRLTSLRPRLVRYAASLSLRPQRRSLNEFISQATPNPDGLSLPGSFRLAVKDNIATYSKDGNGLATTCASGILTSHDSPFEATIVKQLEQRGGHVVGKTNLDEFGMGTHSVNTPHGAVAQLVGDTPTELSAGGSSGGSAVAVATGAADVALGTDTGGSVRLPAAYCGVVGYKPSYGMISRYGVVPYANSLDTVGLLARDARRLREVVVSGGLHLEHDARDPTSLSPSARARCTAARGYYDAGVQRQLDDGAARTQLLRPLTFGIPVEYNIAELDGCVRDAWEEAARVLRDEVGARVVPVSLPSTRHALSAYYVIAPAEASSNLAKYDGVRYGIRQPEIEGTKTDDNDPGGVLYSAVRGAGFGAEVKRRILLGSYTLSSEAMDNYFVQAQRVRQLVRKDFDRVFRLPNPLRDDEDQQFSLADMDEAVALENKLGPTQVDFLLCPTAPTLAPRLEDVQSGQETNPVDAYMNDVFTVPASLAGLPAVSIPKGVVLPREEEWRGKGHMGLQIIGQYWDDARLLAVADALGALFK
ncbi:Trimeric GatFAB AmidoTransferase(AdT) complex subunit [Cytospora paraplurivora]|uniref:Glutamyl-tRNA(Gln) amidotransferase subunit A, mitochondrial n=1 Tax=Cytospora paraplurivora TaxID=2898453 RepID=A0AAN9U5I4_9PEZI